MKKHVILVGLMGSGKSTIAKMLRRKLALPLYELDHLIEQQAGKSIPEIFAQDGESTFRKLERQTVADLGQLEPGVVSTGGGTFVDEENRKSLLRSGWVVYLYGTPPELAKRIQSTATRPLLQGRDKEEVLSELFVVRDPCYQQADMVVSTDQRSSQEVFAEICQIYDDRQKQTADPQLERSGSMMA